MAEPISYLFTVPKHLVAGGSTEEVVHVCLKALIKEVEEVREVFSFERIAAIVYDYRRSQLDLFSGQISKQELFAQFQSIKAQSNNHAVTNLAIEQAKSLCFDDTVHVSQIEDARALLVEKTLISIVDYQFLSRVAYELVSEKFGSLVALNEWKEGEFFAELRTQAKKLVASFVQDPMAKKISIPRSPMPKRSTAELLHEPIPTFSAGVAHESISTP